MKRASKAEPLNTAQAAKLLNLRVETVRSLARRGEIPGSRQGQDWRFHSAALLRWSAAKSGEATTTKRAGGRAQKASQKSSGKQASEQAGQRTSKKTSKKSQQLSKHEPRRSTAHVPQAVGLDDRQSSSFPIVGIGASAGGLEAVEQFLRHVPEKSGMAIVVVQHLDPTHKDMMVELLSRVTPMKVLQIKDRMRVEPDTAYVIPPNKNLSILHGVLHLLVPDAPRGLRLPIDFFFQSLAADQKARSIGVVLSGMGSDGTRGIAAIKEMGGAVFAQAPTSAKFDAMPRSAIDTGLVDVVAPVEELARRILGPDRGAAPTNVTERMPESKAESAIERICLLLRAQTGHDFSQYKRSTVYRRIERRMGLHQLDSIAGYWKHLQDNPQETLLLFKEMLIGVTSFFRDPGVWEYLKQQAIPALLSERNSSGQVRAWVPGCSTGEEAYSLAIVFKEALAKLRSVRNFSVQIFATDLDKDAIERARQGIYPLSISSNVSAERLRRFFVKDGQSYRVTPEIREAVVFATQNVIRDPPFTKLDVLSCRNLLMYLTPELQKKILPLFHYSLNPGGILILGTAETLGPIAHRFDRKGSRARIYRRLDGAPRPEQVEFPSSFRYQPAEVEPMTVSNTPSPNLHTLADRLLLERYSPAAVLTNGQGDILYVSGHTGKYLEPAAGRANWNIHAMSREDLRHILALTFQQARRTNRVVVQTGVKLGTNDSVRTVDVTIEPLHKPEALRGLVLVVFADVAIIPALAKPTTQTKPTSNAATIKLERELLHVREELNTTREEMQSSQEELKSTNEELQSTNEELQSTNEELTTSKEEMQSLNEELQTLNQELQAKLDELSHTNNDMRNLLDSTDIATLFLDDGLNVRRFTARMKKLINLIPGDVGRPITDLSSDLVYPGLAADAQEVLSTLVFKENPIQTVDGRWFSVRIMPYRTLDNRLDGVVITFADITAAKMLEAQLRAIGAKTVDA